MIFVIGHLSEQAKRWFCQIEKQVIALYQMFSGLLRRNDSFVHKTRSSTFVYFDVFACMP